ncbi:TPA: hypothetical protein U5D59_000446 [Yersinia enterocolitica]|nr:hypothetical protein [Yersinia enterocolitica]
MSTELQSQALEEANKKIQQLEIQSEIHQALICGILKCMSSQDLKELQPYISSTETETNKQIKKAVQTILSKAAEDSELKGR